MTGSFIKVNNTEYAVSVFANTQNPEWDYRYTMKLVFTEEYSTMAPLFENDTPWYYVTYMERYDEETEQTVTERTEIDRSEFCVCLQKTNEVSKGGCTITMGKQTDLENLIEIVYGPTNFPE